MAFDKPQNVCPVCGERGRERVEGAKAENPANTPFRCTHCGHVARMCEFKKLTPSERDESKRAKAERVRSWHAERAEHVRRYKAEWYRSNADRIKHELRVRYRDDVEFRDARRERVRVYGKKYRDEHREERREKNRRYQMEHRYEIAMRKKRARLAKLREEKRCGSAT